MPKSDPLVAALDAAETPRQTLEQYLSARPEARAALLRAAERGVRYSTIVEILAAEGFVCHVDTVGKWCRANGVRQ